MESINSNFYQQEKSKKNLVKNKQKDSIMEVK